MFASRIWYPLVSGHGTSSTMQSILLSFVS